MASSLQASDLPDLVVTTLANLGPARFQQIAQNLQYYEAFSRWFRADKVQLDSGYQIQRTVMTTFDSAAAAHVGLNHTDQVNIANNLTTLTIPWRHAQASWGIIFQTDILMNRGRSMVLDVLIPRRADALLALVEELENRAWGTAPSTTNTTLPYSIQYYIVENATEGFTGVHPGSHTSVAGINANNVPKWKNYAAQYTDVSKTDLITKMRDAHRQLQFMSPITINDYRGSVGQRYRIYVNRTTIRQIEDIGEAQNENLGRDIATLDGQIVFRGHPIIWIPKLDERSDGPMYMVDHNTFYPVCLRGNYLRETEANKAPNQHNTFQVFIDLSYNYLCVDRRRNAVFSTSV